MLTLNLPSGRLRRTALVTALLLLPTLGCESPNPAVAGAPVQNDTILAEVDSILNQQLDLWYPRVVDQEHGGYLSRYDYRWEPEGAQEKMIVTQARHIWTLAKVAEEDPARRDDYLAYARHGFDFLRDRMWDREFGGFYTDVTREGVVIPAQNGQINKGLYGNAFAIYGLAAYYGASQDQEALDLAIETFRWLDAGAWDGEFGGYYTNLDRQGQPTGVDSRRAKDYNSGIHILEALAELYQVWPDPVLRDRLERTFRIVRDEFTTDRGYMKLYFSRDWIPLSNEDSTRAVQEAGLASDHITFGHDIETAYLLIESAHALGLPDDSVLTKAKRMVDHTIEHGWDDEIGGVYDAGYYFAGEDSLTITDPGKVWWGQAEALHSLLLAAEYFPDDPYEYFELFEQQWEYIKEYLLDPVHGDWYNAGIDEEPQSVQSPKSTIWKGNYHTVRALLGVKKMLEG
jgi:cellobiose epimerase